MNNGISISYILKVFSSVTYTLVNWVSWEVILIFGYDYQWNKPTNTFSKKHKIKL